MHKSILLVSATALLFSLSSRAENIHFPEEIIPLQVGERSIESSLFSRVDNVELAPGSYQLKLKYSDLYELGFDDHEVVESEPFWVQVTIAAGKDYILEFNRAKNPVAAKVFAASPQVSLKTKGSPLAKPLAIISSAQLANAQPVSQVNQPVEMADKSQSATAPVNTKGVPSAAEMLDFWWQQATPAQQQAFLNKVTK